ncbi:MAG: Bax inhibitor-1 family protein [bacterium]|nr:Bax inhibitor-1 family protein [bacterium]
MNQQNPYGGQQPQWGQPQQPQQQQGWGGQPQQQQGWQQHAGGMHPGMQMPGGHPGQGPSQGYDESNMIASEASVEARSKFIERTYIHLAGAIATFVVLSAGFQMIPGIDEMVFNLLMVSEYSWLAVMGAFIAVSYVADSWAKGSRSAGMQYAGLGLYTVAEAVIFLPMIILARQFIGTEGIMTAGGVTLAMFAGLTAYVFVTKKDFSFMRGVLSIVAVGALGLIVASIIFGFQLGLAFSVGMVVLACGYILYYTSNVLHHYRINQHVAAALALFSAVALLFWYILRIFMSRR